MPIFIKKIHALAQFLLSRVFSWDVVDVGFPTCLNTSLVSQIPIYKMVSQILVLKKAIDISNTNWYFECRLVLRVPIGQSR
jgi:hypothetical protein